MKFSHFLFIIFTGTLFSCNRPAVPPPEKQNPQQLRDQQAILEADVLSRHGESIKAMRVLKEAIGTHSTNVALLRERILVLLRARQSDLAYAAYQQLNDTVSPHDSILLEALRNQDPAIRETAAQTLAVFSDSISLQALKIAVMDSNQSVRLAVSNALLLREK